MNGPISPSDPRYDAFARELVASNILGDPWIYGRERFRLDPVVLSMAQYTTFGRAAERLAIAFDEGARIVLERPALLDEYFHLTPYQKLMWLASGGRWHGIARLDLFLLPDGSIRCCEMNSDTPSGEAEAVLLNRMRHAACSELIDPNAGFEERFVELVEAFHGSVAGASRAPLAIAIVYPTDLPEDLSMIALYRRWLEARGHRVVLGAPANLATHGGRVTLFGSELDVVIRHYKTDWWGERLPVWSDDPGFDDPEPLDGPLRVLLDADADGRVAVMNPFGSVVTQNKLMMAFLWDHLALLSPDAADAVRTFIPETRRLVDVDGGALDRAAWVLKSDYGCEGDEVIIGRAVDDRIWSESLAKALPEHWIVQRFFDAVADDDLGIANYGVYLLGGLAAGIYTRISKTATDTTALSTPTFVAP
jgi:glutathionylspermidine synthase